MNVSRIQPFIWVPLQRQHLIASLCSAGVMMFFGLSGFGGFPAFKAYAEITANSHQLRIFDLLLFAANYLFLWRQAVPSYLRVRRSFLPVLASLGVLSVAALLLTAAFRPASAASTATAVSRPNTSTGSAMPHQHKQNWLRLLLVAQGGLALVILTTGLWKNDDETIVSFARYLSEVRRLRARFERGITITEELRQARSALLSHLELLIDWLEKNQYLTYFGPPAGGAASLLKDCKEARQTAAQLDIGYFATTNHQAQKFKFLDPITNFA